MFENLNITIVIAVVIIGIIGFIAFIAFGDGKIKQGHPNDELDDYQERRSAGSAGAHDPYYSDFPSHRD